MTPSFFRFLPDGRQISAAGFGCSPTWARPSLNETMAARLLDKAADGGVNYFDTGPSYQNGEAERRLGRWLNRRHASNLLVSTKVGTNLDAHDRRIRSFSPSVMEKSLTGSLMRLRLDRIDILYLHGPLLDQLTDDVLKFLELEKKRGRILWSGINSFDKKVLGACIDYPIDAYMIQYDISSQNTEALVSEYSRRGKIIISGTALSRAAFPLKTFIPTTRAKLWRLFRALKSDPMFLVKGAALNRRLTASGEDGPGAAMRFVTGNPSIHSAIFGTGNLDHVDRNISAARDPMPPEMRKSIINRA